MTDPLPLSIRHWLDVIVPSLQVLLILVIAFVLHRVSRRLINSLVARYGLPREMAIGSRRLLAFVIYGASLLLVLERLGVSGTVLWTAFTGFATVAAVAFFAAWSVLSNIFCSVLIFVLRPFRLMDHIEVLDAGDKLGMRGRVVDVNLVYTTLEETHDDGQSTVLQVPNNMFFQKTTRRWRDGTRPVPIEAPAVVPTAAKEGE